MQTEDYPDSEIKQAQEKLNTLYDNFTKKYGLINSRANTSAFNADSSYALLAALEVLDENGELERKDVRIFDYIEDDEGKKKAVLNKKETAIAQSKQELIKQGFQDWIWADPTRREKLTKLYNEKFNSIRPREYDGIHITFSGMNPEESKARSRAWRSLLPPKEMRCLRQTVLAEQQRSDSLLRGMPQETS